MGEEGIHAEERLISERPVVPAQRHWPLPTGARSIPGIWKLTGRRDSGAAILHRAMSRLRVAVLGTSGVDSELRKVLDAPDPPPGSTLIPKRRDKRKHTDDETPLGTDIAG